MDKKQIIARRAAQYFSPGDTVNLGVGIPCLCADYAPKDVWFETENGFLGVGPKAEGVQITECYSNAAGDYFTPVAGGVPVDSALSFGMIRGGRMAASVLGGLQVSEQGDLANWAVPGRLFGMGGAMDLCSGVRTVIVAMELCTKDGRPKIVKQCSLPLTGRHCVDHIVTELCVIDVTPNGLVLKEIAPGVSVEEIREKVEPELTAADDLKLMWEGENNV